MSRLLGVDLGDRRIGLALGDRDTGIARSLVTIRRTTPARDATIVARLCAEHRAHELVVGMPLHLDGSAGPQAAATRTWAEAIAQLVEIPLTFRDERMTSVAAEASVGRMARARDGGPPTRRTRQRHRAAVDRDAARRILQAELDAEPHDTPSSPVLPALPGSSMTPGTVGPER